ncbi:MAG: hypothetical protein J5835_05865 [Bacteroidales bacterium]|nr:hypothetical protein [Bacteroidales bacterium]
MKAYSIALASIAIAALASCTQETPADNYEQGPKVKISFKAQGEADIPESKVTLDFSQTQNVRWSDDDLIAVFDGTAKNQFGIDGGTNTGATATFSGEVTPGYANLYAVYPYSAANSLSAGSLSVTVPSNQTVSSTAKVDPAALVSVGQVSAGTIEFKQVCGLLKFEITTANVSQVILRGTNLAGTATVATSGIISSVTSGESQIAVSCSEGTFAIGAYYAAVLPGTTAAGSFKVDFVESSGLTHSKTASSAVTVVRKQGKAIGAFDNSYSLSRHIFNKAQLFAWGEAMVGDEQKMPVYLEADIDCTGDTWSYTGTEFNGQFYGQNHKICNLVVQTSTRTGLIYTLDGSIKDLVFGSSDGNSWDNTSRITHTGTAGEIEYVGLVCRLTGDGSISNVKNFAKVEVPSSSSSRAYVGGIVGNVPDTATGAVINHSKNYGAVSNASSWSGNETRMGGIVGQGSGALAASGIENHGAITVANSVTNFVGGLCGDLATGSSVTGSSNYGTITFTGGGTQQTYVGGCFGSVRGSTISDCHNYAAVTVTRNAQHRFGGILGLLQSGTIMLSGCVNHTGADLTVASSVAARTVLGGIAGACLNGNSSSMTVTIEDCKNEADIVNNGASSEIGGIVGMLDSEYSGAAHTFRVLSCENTGAVSNAASDVAFNSLGRELRIGGIIGSSDADSGLLSIIIRSCINRGDVTTAGALTSGKAVRIGGISGLAWYDALFDKCKNFGDVECNAAGSDGGATMNMGGIVGFFEARTSSRYQRITDCVNTGEVSSIRNVGTQYIGGILGSVNNAGGYSNYGLVDGSKNYGTISATRQANTMVGGICGYAKHTISNCSDFGSISGGAWNGAVVGDGNSSAVITTGIKVGNGVEVTGAANANTKYSNGNTTYSFTTTMTNEKRWFSGWSDAAITVTVVGQETYDGSSSGEPAATGGYLFAHTGDGDGYYYRLFYAISHDGLSWTELNSGNSPMPSYYGFPYITQDSEGNFWMIGVSNNTPRHPVIWKSADMVAWTVYKNISASVMALPSGYENDTNSFGAMKIFFDPVSEQFIITWHASEEDYSGDDYWESMRTFYILTSDFETFTPAQKLFAFTGSDANMAQIDATIHYYNGRYYALIKDERTYHSSSTYYKRPRIAVSNSLTGPYNNPGGALTPKHREGPTLVQSPDKSYWYLYVENYDSDPHVYELYRSNSLSASGWEKVAGFTPPTTQSICRHGCVIPIDATVYSRLEAVYGN